MSRESVRSLAPIDRPNCASVRSAAGSASRSSPSRRTSGCVALGTWIAWPGAARNSSKSTALSRDRASSSVVRAVYATMISRSSGLTVTTVGCARPSGLSSTGSPTNRSSSSPYARCAWTVPAGTQIACEPGVTQTPASVVTETTPRRAYTSWC